MKTLKALILLTSHDALGSTGEPTGLWLEELAVPYQVFRAAGAEVTLASPRGGAAPVDPRSLQRPSEETQAFLADERAAHAMKHTVKLGELRGTFDLVFVAGGHGTMFDLPNSSEVAALLSKQWAEGRVVAAVCHGPAALVGAKNPDGTPLVQGRRVSAFSDDEERAAKLDAAMPFLLESKLTSLGARYEKADLWQPKVVRDGLLVTGQNPASSRGVAEEALAAVKAGRH